MEIVVIIWIGDMRKYALISEEDAKEAPLESSKRLTRWLDEHWDEWYSEDELFNVNDLRDDDDISPNIDLKSWAIKVAKMFPTAYIIHTPCSCCCNFFDVRKTFRNFPKREIMDLVA